MDIERFHEKHVRLTTIYGDTFTGIADYNDYDYLKSEWGGKEDGLFIGDFLVYNSQIASIEEIEVHGTAELWTEYLVLRRYRPEDAEILYMDFGTDPAMYRYSGWNPYATPDMARDTVSRIIAGYEDENTHDYSWVMEYEDVLIGTIGAYDYKDDQIEVGFSVAPGWQGHGYAAEALEKVLEYLTDNEGISRVIAWCASENIASKRTLEKVGMKLTDCENDGLSVGGRTYDKLTYEYRKKNS